MKTYVVSFKVINQKSLTKLHNAPPLWNNIRLLQFGHITTLIHFSSEHIKNYYSHGAPPNFMILTPEYSRRPKIYYSSYMTRHFENYAYKQSKGSGTANVVG